MIEFLAQMPTDTMIFLGLVIVGLPVSDASDDAFNNVNTERLNR